MVCKSICKDRTPQTCTTRRCKYIAGPKRQYCRLNPNYTMDANCVVRPKLTKQTARAKIQRFVLTRRKIEASQIPRIVNAQHMYNPDIQLYFYSGSSAAAPGKGAREKMPDDQLEVYKESLKAFPHFRKMLSNFAIAPFRLDGMDWLTVEHYYQGSKFKKENPDFYRTFSIQSGTEMSKHPAMAKAYGGKSGKYQGKQIRPRSIQMDADFFVGENTRGDQEMFDAQQAKFTQNQNMRDVLLATKDAQLIHTMPRSTQVIPFDNLVYLRDQMKKQLI